MKSYIHPSSFVDEGAKIGAGTNVWHFCHVMQGAVVGESCTIGQGCMVAGGAVIGNRVKIQNNVSVFSGVSIEDDAFIGPSCVFTNVRTPRAFVDRKAEFVHTLIGRGASLGAGSVIVCGVRVGSYSLIGAGSVVTDDIPDFAMAYGNPARVKGWVCRCGQPLGESLPAVCPRCAARYGTAVMRLSEEVIL